MIKFAMCLLLLCAAGANAADETTWFVYNGRWWTSASAAIRLGYVAGFNNAAVWFKGQSAVTAIPLGARFGEISDSIDQFYREPANMRIPVALALEWITAKMAGKSPEQLETLLASLRAFAISYEPPEDAKKNIGR